MTKAFRVIVELYELLLTARKDDRFGRVVSTGSLKIDDLINIAVSRGTELSAATLKAAYETIKNIALEELCDAKEVEFGLTHCGLNVSGVFLGDHAAWNPATHHLTLRTAPTVEARKVLKNIAVEVRGMAQTGLFINALTDVTSGEVNARITPSGGVNLTGSKIKLAGEAPGMGIYFTEVNSGQVHTVPLTLVLINEPSRITFIVPNNLPAGDYKLSITTQYNPSALLKEPRSYTHDYVLACN